jgi:hypothetical protein
MLYGTRKELNKKLKRMFGNEERYALLVWTKEDVMAQVENMTEHEAHIVLELIGQTGTGDHAEEGVIPYCPGPVRGHSGEHPPHQCSG